MSRRCHADERNNTYLSPCHNIYSRINLFVADKWLLQENSASTIHTVTWSDHVPISITVSTKPTHPPSYIWQANNLLLQDPTYATSLSQHLENFFPPNSDSVADPATVWTAHRARAKKKRMQRLDKITAALTTSEILNKMNPSPSLLSKMFLLRQKLRSLLLDSYEKTQRKIKAKLYFTGNKANKAMAL